MQRMLWGRVAMLVAAGALMNCGQHPVTDGGADTIVVDAVADTTVITDTGPRDVSVVDTGLVADAGACGAGTMGCNPVTLSGCAPGQACVLTGANMYGCMPPGTGGYGTTCNDGSNCLESFGCIGGTCRKLCCSLGDHLPCRTGNGGRAGAICDTNITGTPQYFACTAVVRCDWFAQNCADGTANCLPADMSGSTTCEPAGTAHQGDNCASTPCARGFVCGMSMGAPNPTCRQICDPTATASTDAGADGGVSRRCPTGFTCGTFGTSRPANFGGCQPMM